MPERAPNYVVKDSPIQGRGLFAARKLRKGTKIVEYTGKRITEKEADKQSSKRRILLFDLGNGWVIDGDYDCPATAANHSCDPNAETDIIDEHIWIIATKTIHQGEEILYDYHLGADETIYKCKCGSKDCRGTLNELG
ncbi:MAG: SET domain-containing protein-lysine N-methyltransferase [bacterium]